MILPALYSEGKSALRYTVAWLWIIPTHWDHGRWVLSQMINKSRLQFFDIMPGLVLSMMCVTACACYTYAFVSSPDHSLWPGELPGEASGVYFSLPEHHGVWCWQHPLSEGGVWSVSQTESSAEDFTQEKITCSTDKPLSTLYYLKIILHVSQWSKNVLYMCVYVCVLAGDSWAGYEHTSFCGQQFVLERGEYPHWESWSGSNAYHIERMMSFRPICSAVSICLSSTASVSLYLTSHLFPEKIQS